MASKIRFAIKIGFILLFFVLAPLIIAYTYGYRFNLETKRVQKTGVLVVNSFPDEARVFIDGKDTGEDTPAVIKKLLPYEHRVEVIKDGYQAWNKKLNTYSGETTFAESIALFYQDEPTPVIERQIIKSSFSPNKNKVVYAVEEASWGEVWVASPAKEDFSLIDRREISNFKNIEFLWSPGDENIFIEIETQTQKEHLIYDLSKKEIVNLEPAFSRGLQNFRWSTSSDYVFYVIDNERLFSYNLLTEQKTFLISGAEQYFTRGDKIYLLRRDKDSIVVEQFSSTNPEAESEVLYTLGLNQYEFLESSFPYLLLKNAGGEILLFDMSTPFSDPILKNYANCFSWYTTDDGEKRLLYGQDFEVRIFNPKTITDDLITRFGEPIKQAEWHRNGNYIFLGFENSVKAIELDSREQRNIFNLFDANAMDKFTLDYQSRNIYFVGSLQDINGLYQYALVKKK